MILLRVERHHLYLVLFVFYEEIFSAEELILETMEKNKKEAEAKAAYEAEQAWLKAERERLADEAESMKPMFKKHHDDLSKLEAAALAKKEVCSSHILLRKPCDSFPPFLHILISSWHKLPEGSDRILGFYN